MPYRATLIVGALVLVACSGTATDGELETVEVDEEYGYVLNTHCGVEWAWFGGSWWRTEPLDDGNANPPDGWDNASQEGRLRIVSVDTAVFTGGPEPIEFARTNISALDDPALPDSVRFCD